ncbi:MAG: hypothetical protein QM792_13625 [Piscinibacter sp.]
MDHRLRDSGHVARYRIDLDAVTILAVRHQKEAGFSRLERVKGIEPSS